jgi:hypothetical protein
VIHLIENKYVKPQYLVFLINKWNLKTWRFNVLMEILVFSRRDRYMSNKQHNFLNLTTSQQGITSHCVQQPRPPYPGRSFIGWYKHCIWSVSGGHGFSSHCNLAQAITPEIKIINWRYFYDGPTRIWWPWLLDTVWCYSLLGSGKI